MSTLLAGVLVTLVPGLVIGCALGGVTGWVLRRNDYCRHPAPPPPPPAVVPVVSERVPPPLSPMAPTVLIVHVHPGAALLDAWGPLGVIEGLVRELPTGSGVNR
jgi:hypothetical protein